MGQVNRRDFLNAMGVAVGAASLATAAEYVAAPRAVLGAAAPEAARGRIPATPVKFGHMTS